MICPTADKNHAPPCAHTLGLILIKTPTPSLTQNGTSVWSQFWPQVWSQTGSQFGQISAPRFDPKRDLILIKILTPVLILNGTSPWSKVWLKFDPKRDLILIKILTHRLTHSGLDLLIDLFGDPLFCSVLSVPPSAFPPPMEILFCSVAAFLYFLLSRSFLCVMVETLR